MDELGSTGAGGEDDERKLFVGGLAWTISDGTRLSAPLCARCHRTLTLCA